MNKRLLFAFFFDNGYPALLFRWMIHPKQRLLQVPVSGLLVIKCAFLAENAHLITWRLLAGHLQVTSWSLKKLQKKIRLKRKTN
jgi:hypothetical protein